MSVAEQIAIKSIYRDKSVGQLIKIATRHFNAWIRERDKGKPCINCGQYRTLEAGHLYPTSTYSGLRFNELNTNGECKQCNYYDSQSHAYKYKPNLIKRIGEVSFAHLEISASSYKRVNHKWTRFELIEIIEKYKNRK